MKLFLVTQDERRVWVAALANEHMYCYVANTGYFHDNSALRNDFYMYNNFEYEEIDVVRAKQLMVDGVGQLDEDERAEPLARWRADPRPLPPNDIFAAVVGLNP